MDLLKPEASVEATTLPKQDPASIPAAPAGGFVVPTHDHDGNPLDARGKMAMLIKQPGFVRDALTPGTQAHQKKQELDRQIVAEQDASAERAADPATGQAPAKSGAEYQLPLVNDGSIPEAAFQQFDATARQWLHAGGFSPEIGSSLASRIDVLSREAPRWSEAEAIRQQNTSWETLERLHGGKEKLEAKLNLARDFISAVDAKVPGLRAMFEEAPYLLDDAQVVHQIIEAAEANAARAAAK